MGHRPCVSSPIFDRFDSYAVSVVPSRPFAVSVFPSPSSRPTSRLGFFWVSCVSCDYPEYRTGVLPSPCPSRRVSDSTRMQCFAVVRPSFAVSDSNRTKKRGSVRPSLFGLGERTGQSSVHSHRLLSADRYSVGLEKNHSALEQPSSTSSTSHAKERAMLLRRFVAGVRRSSAKLFTTTRAAW